MKRISSKLVGLFAAILLVAACEKKGDIQANNHPSAKNEEAQLRTAAQQLQSSQQQEIDAFSSQYSAAIAAGRSQSGQQNIVQIASGLPFFKSLVAAVVKTGLAPTLASSSLNATVFAPTDDAFAKLPAPFNNATNIANITEVTQINALRNILLYHVLGAEVKRSQLQSGRSSAQTLKPAVNGNDNTIYISNSGLLFINGNSLVVLADVDASNGVIHVINNVLLPPSQTIAQIATGNANLSSLVAALVKTNLVGAFTGSGDLTVFAPTNAAFAKLPAPFNNAQNIGAITNAAQIAALSNILLYHVSGSRYFAWDLGLFQQVTTLAAAPKNKVTGLLGITNAYVKGNANTSFAQVHPTNVLATNGVVHIVDQVLLP